MFLYLSSSPSYKVGGTVIPIFTARRVTLRDGKFPRFSQGFRISKWQSWNSDSGRLILVPVFLFCKEHKSFKFMNQQSLPSMHFLIYFLSVVL